MQLSGGTQQTNSSPSPSPTVSPTTSPSPGATIAPERCYIVQKTPSLVIRSGPGTTYAQIGGLREGDRLSGVEQVSGWLKVEVVSVQNHLLLGTNPTEAWVGADYVRPCATPPDPISQEPAPEISPIPPPNPPPPAPPSTGPSVPTRCEVCIMHRNPSSLY